VNSRAPRLGTAARLLLTGWVVYTLHFATDIAREHYPAFSLAERGTLRVDPYLGLHPDLFAIPDRGAFINNNPGASLLGALPYAVARPLVDALVARASAVRSDGPPPEFADPRPDRREFFARTYARGLDIRFGLAAGVMQAFGTAPLSAAMLLVMYSVLRRFGFSGRESMWLALVYGFATPIFFRAAFLNHNLFVAHATLGGFALLQRADGITHDPRRLAAAGAVSGAGLLCDYAGAVPLVALGSYALARLFKTLPAGQAVSRFGAMVAGACLPVGALLVYQAWAFGHPLLPAQHYMPATQYSGLGWNGFDWPALDLLAQNLLDPRFGMLAFGPLLALAFAQPLLGSGRRSRVHQPERVLALGLFFALLVFTSANQYARLQWNTGFRMLAPAVPLLFVLCADVLTQLPRRVAIALAGLATAHAWSLAMVRADAIESIATVLTSGPRLPWLTSVWRAGSSYLPSASEQLSPSLLAAPFLAVGAGLLVWIWTRAWPEGRREHERARG